MNVTMAKNLLCISRYFNIDRILLYSTFLESVTSQLTPFCWSGSSNEAGFPKTHVNSKYFFELDTTCSLPHWLTIPRHFNNYFWDGKGYSTSRNSFWKQRRENNVSIVEKAMFSLANSLGHWLSEEKIEAVVSNLLHKYGVTKKALSRIERIKPDIVMSLLPFDPLHMAYIVAAKSKKIPVVAFIPSWDNLSTKNRMILDYDAYIVWSDAMRDELHYFYPQSHKHPVYVTGAPQYDVYFQPKFQQTRQHFCAQYGLDDSRPIITYCLGSPNLIKEDFGALEFIKHAQHDSVLSQTQFIVRLHPGFMKAGYQNIEVIKQFPGVVVQESQRNWKKDAFQDEEDICEWVNTMRHSNVVINLTSTVLVDAAIAGRPVINLDFDPEPGAPNQQLIKEINHKWNHSRPVIESGGVWLVNDYDEMLNAARAYLEHPELHMHERNYVIDFVAGKVDGFAGKRMADSVIDFATKYSFIS